MSKPDYPIPPESQRERTVVWHEARDVAPLVAGLSGLEIMQRIRDGLLPSPPMAKLIGFQCTKAEEGEIAMTLPYDPSLENTLGMVHGGAVATMLDTAMGAAAHTVLPVGSGVVTLDLTITYLRPITADNAPIIATGRVRNTARRIIYVLGEVKDARGKLVAHAVGNFSILAAKDNG